MPTIPGPVVVTGGGFQIGSSFLKANSPDASGLGGVAVFVPWTRTTFAAADIQIDGGDSTKINILTTGWYSFSFHADVFPDSATLSFVTMRSYLNGLDPAHLYVDEGPSIPSGIDDFENTLIEPGAPFNSGDAFYFRLQANPTSTWAYAETRLSVTRLS